MSFVDSHVNLHAENFADDLDTVVDNARATGVGTMLNICCRVCEFGNALAIAETYDNIYTSIGTHPHHAKDNPDITPDEIIAYTKNEKVIGIGETGLDFHYNYSEAQDQYPNFQAHIEAARQTGLPLIIHARNADKEMADILEHEMKIGEFPALLHCFSSGPELAKRTADLGVYFSVSGILSFKNAHENREIVKWLPADRLLIETDCPYLAPVPHRGQRNEPKFVVDVARALSELRGWSLEDTGKRTTDAFYRLFTKAKR
ncbi:MAG TPA: TatD family deoxyribonuclease, partial [Hellea balneolensis]|nr:TatD family deoxyribonuclease [Hellea balneolensis]